MRIKIENGEMDRDLLLYNTLLLSTEGLKELDYKRATENLHTEIIYLFNKLVMKQMAVSLEEQIDLFNRVWIGVGSTKELTRYRKRGLFYIQSLTINNWSNHFIIYLLITAIC